MYFKIYDYITGDIIDQVSAFNFGDILQNQHSVQPVVFRAFSDSTEAVTDLKMYLENTGSWSDSEFGYYTSSSFISSVESGSSIFTHLTAIPDASSTSPNGVTVGWDTCNSDFVWLDTQITDRTGMTNANYRFFYNYT